MAEVQETVIAATRAAEADYLEAKHMLSPVLLQLILRTHYAEERATIS